MTRALGRACIVMPLPHGQFCQHDGHGQSKATATGARDRLAPSSLEASLVSFPMCRVISSIAAHLRIAPDRRIREHCSGRHVDVALRRPRLSVVHAEQNQTRSNHALCTSTVMNVCQKRVC